MNDKAIRCDIFRKIVPLFVHKFQIQSRLLPDPARDFDAADIFTNRMMGAQFQPYR
jgi:hypothetical protein